jgi:hypothetical protein
VSWRRSYLVAVVCHLPSVAGDQPLAAGRPPLPAVAREGVMRVWLSILRERHPQMLWVAAERDPSGAEALPSAVGRRGLSAAS